MEGGAYIGVKIGRVCDLTDLAGGGTLTGSTVWTSCNWCSLWIICCSEALMCIAISYDVPCYKCSPCFSWKRWCSTDLSACWLTLFGSEEYNACSKIMI